MKSGLFVTFTKTTLAICTVAYLVYYVDPTLIIGALESADGWWIFCAILLLPVNLALETIKWHLMLRPVAETVAFRESFGAMMSGYALGFFTPARVGDYAGRAFYLKHADKWQLAAITFAERMLTLICYVGFGVAALAIFLFINTDLAAPAWYAITAVGCLVTSGAILLALKPRLTYCLLVRISPIRQIRQLVRFLLLYTPGKAASFLALSALRYFVFTSQFVLLLYAFEPAFPIFHAYTAIALVFFAKSAIPSLTLADLGVREGASIFFLGAFGVAASSAFNASFLLFCINVLTPALLGAPFLLRLRLSCAALDEKELPAELATATATSNP